MRVFHPKEPNYENADEKKIWKGLMVSLVGAGLFIMILKVAMFLVEK